MNFERTDKYIENLRFVVTTIDSYSRTLLDSYDKEGWLRNLLQAEAVCDRLSGCSTYHKLDNNGKSYINSVEKTDIPQTRDIEREFLSNCITPEQINSFLDLYAIKFEEPFTASGTIDDLLKACSNNVALLKEKNIITAKEENELNLIWDRIRFKFNYLLDELVNTFQKYRKSDKEINEVPAHTVNVDADEIFRSGKHKELLRLEDLLIRDNFLDRNRNWISEKKHLQIFVQGLIENGYFLPKKKNNLLKCYFEKRYNINMNELFQASRLSAFTGQYEITFSEYIF